MFSGFFRAVPEPASDADNLQPRFNSLLLNKEDDAVGKTLDEINLAELNVEVNSVRRHNVEGSHPSGNMVLRAGDVLMLLGEPVSLDAAERRLRGGDV